MFLSLFFQDLNLYLQDKVYLAGNSFTLADAFMYFGIHPLMVSHYFFLFLSCFLQISMSKSLFKVST